MNRFISTLAALSLCAVSAAAHAEMPGIAEQVQPTRSTLARTAPDAGVQLGTRLARLGRLRTLGADFDLAVGGLFDGSGAQSFRRWRLLADTLADATDQLPFHQIVVVARAPGLSASAIEEAGKRAQMLVDALSARGIDSARIESLVAPPSAEGIDLQIRFERMAPRLSPSARVGG